MSDRPEWMNIPANYPHSAKRPPEHRAWCSARCNLAGCERPHACSCPVDNADRAASDNDVTQSDT